MTEPQDAIPDTDPIVLFAEWFALAEAAEPNDPNAMALATATAGGCPSVRMVLLKGQDENGFMFYTNAQSRKGEEIAENPHAALLFHWKSLRRQIRIEGELEEVTPEEADAYFASRSRASQLGSAASDQSRALADRQVYLDRVAALESALGDQPVQRPPHWTGFRLAPARMEFWQDRAARLHERRQFKRLADGSWTSTLLYP